MEGRSTIAVYEHTAPVKIFHPLLALIASAADRQLARYVEFLKEENKILRARIKGQIHTKPGERQRLLVLGKALGQAIEELITIVSPSTFYRWIRDENEPETKRPKGGSRKPREIRELVIEIAKTRPDLPCLQSCAHVRHHFRPPRHSPPAAAFNRRQQQLPGPRR